MVSEGGRTVGGGFGRALAGAGQSFKIQNCWESSLATWIAAFPAILNFERLTPEFRVWMIDFFGGGA
jgi:hypothetical protein